MNHILNRVEYREIIEVKFLQRRRFLDELQYLNDIIQDSMAWEKKTYAINHVLSICLEQLQDQDIDLKTLIETIYNYSEYCNFYIQEGSSIFIESLFQIEHRFDIDLEEDLISAQKRICYG